MSKVYWSNFQKRAKDYNAWYRMDQEFGGYSDLLVDREAKAFLELLHYHWSLDNFQ